MNFRREIIILGCFGVKRDNLNGIIVIEIYNKKQWRKMGYYVELGYEKYGKNNSAERKLPSKMYLAARALLKARSYIT